jgi:hypothetical protein
VASGSAIVEYAGAGVGEITNVGPARDAVADLIRLH